MRILFISQYFQPEVGAGVTRVAYTAKYLANQNHEVTVIAGTPNYPTGKVYKGYKNSLFQREVLDKQVGVVRTFVYPTRYTSMLKRLLNYTSFALSGTIASVLRK